MFARAISVPCSDHFILYSDASSEERLKLAIIDGQRPDRKLIPQETPRILKDIMIKSWDPMGEERPEFSGSFFNFFCVFFFILSF